MKNFIVSNLRNFWILNSDEFVFSTKFLEKDNLDFIKSNKLKYSTKASHLRKSTNEFEEDADFADSKYNKYLKLLPSKLNDINNKNYSDNFWKKALSLGLIRTITLLHEHFKIYESNFDINAEKVNLLSQTNFFTPKDFEDQRILLNDNEFGNEQIFALYVDCFFPKNNFKRILYHKLNDPLSFKNGIIQILLKVKRFIYTPFFINPTILILGSYFSKHSKNKLIKKSNNQVKEIFLYPKKSSMLQLDKRKQIFREKKYSDDFDKFFFYCLPFLMPKILIEDFNSYEKYFLNKLDSIKKAKTIINENFGSNSINSLFLAFAKECFQINHIYNEHNCFMHIYAGHFTKYVVDLSDNYYSIGWNMDHNKVIKSSTLFHFRIKQNKAPSDILFIASPFYEKYNHYISIYRANENVLHSIDFIDSFFQKIPNKLKQQIYYKGYRKSNLFKNREDYYIHYKDKFKVLNPEVKAKGLMKNAKLLIIDYAATSYLEGLISDIPTLVLFDTSGYSLKAEHESFFKPLIDSGIFQTSPTTAAELLEKIYFDPIKWWKSDKVTNGKEQFLKNIDNSDLFINQILSQF